MHGINTNQLFTLVDNTASRVEAGSDASRPAITQNETILGYFDPLHVC